MLASMYNTYLC